jgi:class I fructose-bisphosphate aldolase
MKTKNGELGEDASANVLDSSALVASSIGKRLRLENIFASDSRSVVFAMDHGVERGPSVFTRLSLDPKVILSKVVEAGVDAVMLNKGVARSTYEIWGNKAGLILKVSGKSELRPKEDQTLQSSIGSVGDAVALRADGVASTVYWGSKFEDLMVSRFVATLRKCESVGMPLLQLAYPRVEGKTNTEVEIVSYAARLAFEIGADAIKTYFTGDRESFSNVVRAAGGIPVLLSGGEASEEPIGFLRVVSTVMAAGAKGVVVGRNVFQHKNPLGMAKAVIKIVHEEWTPDKAITLVK